MSCQHSFPFHPGTLRLPNAELRDIFTDLPETPVILRAFDFSRDHMPHHLLNHVTRPWIFATKLASARGDRFDAEVVAVSKGTKRIEGEGAGGGTRLLPRGRRPGPKPAR